MLGIVIWSLSHSEVVSGCLFYAENTKDEICY